MIDPKEAIEVMCERYQAAVSASDSIAYKRLFCTDAIRMPPGAGLEHGSDAIANSEQSDYDQATWTVKLRPLDTLWINDDWVYGIAEADIHTVSHVNRVEKTFKATITWLLQQQSSGGFLIKRQMWSVIV